MQIGFSVWNKITYNQIKNKIYIFFFCASVLIYIKTYFPDKVQNFNNWLNDQNICIYYVKFSEKLIYENMNNIFYPKSSDIIQLLNQINDNIQLSSNLKNLILFSLMEYDIYGKYNKFIIILACSIINLYSFSEKMENEKNSIKTDLINSIKQFNVINIKELENCIKDIINSLNNNDDNNDDEYLNNSSNNSLNQLFSNFENTNNTNNNNISEIGNFDKKNNNKKGGK